MFKKLAFFLSLILLLNFSIAKAGYFDFASDTTANPTFSVPGGFYQAAINISLTAPDGATIYYTLDGTLPGLNTLVYSVPITMDSTTAIRCIAITSDEEPSETITQTYFINEPINLPIISIVTAPDNFFDDRIGIYITGTNGRSGACDNVVRNLNQDWERPVNLEFYEKDGTMGLNQRAGIKIFGGCSRTRFPQKSLALFARKKYGNGDFDYQLFPDKDIDNFEAFILRSSADDQVYTMMKDAFATYSLLEFMDVDYQAYRPTAVYINGQYWGIHNLREKVNEHFISDNFDVKKSKINILEANARIVYGDNSSYNEMIEFVSNSDLTIAENYEALEKTMDINQYLDYEISNIHLAEVDWPGNNIKFWQADNSPFNRWRWIQFDRDQTYKSDRIETNALNLATTPSGTGWPNPPWSTLLLRRALSNPDFRNRFIQTYAYHMATTFDADRVSQLLDIFIERLEKEMPRHIEKWGGQLDPDKSETWPPPTFNSMEEWESNVEEIRDFLPLRKPFALQHMKTQFAVDNRSEITISSNVSDQGLILFYEKELSQNFSAEFFNDIPFKLKAIAKEGYQFSHWEQNGQNISDAEISVIPTSNLNIIAHFEESTSLEIPLVINEINYNSSDEKDAGDWLEIFNPNNSKVNMSGWKLRDGNPDNLYIFPTNTEIAANGYLVLCHSVTDFDVLFPNIVNRLGGLNFKFSNKGEVIKLYTANEVFVDSVSYLDLSPWPVLADGGGSTLELIEPDLDNTLAINWKASVSNGSPGRTNKEIILANGERLKFELGFRLNQNYPNPVEHLTKLSYELSKNGHVLIKLFNSQGRLLETIVNQYQSQDEYQKVFNAESLNSGIYFVAMQFDETAVQVVKMVVR